MEDAMAAWQSLFFEYCDLAGTKSYRAMFSLKKEIGTLQSKLLTVRSCLAVLKVTAIPECIAALRREGYNYPFDDTNPDAYLKDVETVEKKSKTIAVSLDMKLKQMDESIGQMGDADVTMADFEKTMVELSHYMGYEVKPHETTVSMYLAILEKHRSEVEAAEKLKSRNG